MVRLFKAAGWTEDRSAGKGSHVMLRKAERNMTLSTHRELSPGLINKALKELGGYKTADLPRLLGGSIKLQP